MTPAPPDGRELTVVAHHVGTAGGMEHQLAQLCGGLLERGYRVTVLARRCELPPHERLTWVRVPGPARPFSFWYPWFFLAGSLLLWRHRRGIVHTTGAIVLNRVDSSTVHFCHRAFRATGPARRTDRAELAYRLNAWFGSVLSAGAERYCYRPRRTRRLVAVSRGVAAELERFFPAMAGCVSAIPNAVDHKAFVPDPGGRAATRRRLGLADGDLVALFVGGEWDRKGLDHAIRAVAQAEGWHLLVVGRGDVERYRALAGEAGAADRVHFAGATADTAPYYASAEAFLLPTAYEAFPLVALEASAAGLPLLMTAVNGVEELLVDGENGYFIERDADVIAARLGQLGADQGRRTAMAEAAARASRRYTWAAVVDAYDALYTGLAAEGRTP